LLLVEDDHHGRLGHPQDVLLELTTIGKLDGRDTQLQSPSVVDQPLAMDLPHRCFVAPSGHTSTLLN
jgi:hypothetical protein